MVHAWQPERAVPAHSLVPRQHIHHRVLQGVTHMQRAGNVRRRNRYRERRCALVAINLGSEAALLLPARVMMFFGLFRIVGFGDVHLVFVWNAD